MAKPIVELNIRAINELMTSAPVQAEIDRAGRAIAARAGAGVEYVPAERRHPWVARGYVRTATAKAARENARRNTLLRALGGGG